MLRASAHADAIEIDLRAVTDRSGDPMIPHGAELLFFVTALLRGDAPALERARAALVQAAGSAAVVRASAVAGTFQMMNRLVDATGVPVGASLRAIAPDLGLAG